LRYENEREKEAESLVLPVMDEQISFEPETGTMARYWLQKDLQVLAKKEKDFREIRAIVVASEATKKMTRWQLVSAFSLLPIWP